MNRKIGNITIRQNSEKRLNRLALKKSLPKLLVLLMTPLKSQGNPEISTHRSQSQNRTKAIKR